MLILLPSSQFQVNMLTLPLTTEMLARSLENLTLTIAIMTWLGTLFLFSMELWTLLLPKFPPTSFPSPRHLILLLDLLCTILDICTFPLVANKERNVVSMLPSMVACKQLLTSELNTSPNSVSMKLLSPTTWLFCILKLKSRWWVLQIPMDVGIGGVNFWIY